MELLYKDLLFSSLCVLFPFSLTLYSLFFVYIWQLFFYFDILNIHNAHRRYHNIVISSPRSLWHCQYHHIPPMSTWPLWHSLMSVDFHIWTAWCYVYLVYIVYFLRVFFLAFCWLGLSCS
jgi:hypothetical protein